MKFKIRPEPCLPILLFLMVTGGGCTTPTNHSLQVQTLLDDMQIGKTTLEDVGDQFGKPTAVHVSFPNAQTKESWAYGDARLGINPARYVPFVGALAVADVAEVESQSVAINFSEQGTVLGFTQRKLARYTIEPAWPGSTEEVRPYGWRNLNARPGFTTSGTF